MSSGFNSFDPALNTTRETFRSYLFLRDDRDSESVGSELCTFAKKKIIPIFSAARLFLAPRRPAF